VRGDYLKDKFKEMI